MELFVLNTVLFAKDRFIWSFKDILQSTSSHIMFQRARKFSVQGNSSANSQFQLEISLVSGNVRVIKKWVTTILLYFNIGITYAYFTR